MWLSSDAERTRIVARVDGLVPPVVIARTGLERAPVEGLLSELLAWTPPPGAVYGRFVPYRDADVRPFFDVLDRSNRALG